MAAIIHGGMVLAWLVAGLCAYWMFWPVDPMLEILDNPRVVVAEARRGEHVARELRFRPRREVTVYTARRFVQQNCRDCKIYEAENTTKDYEVREYKQVRAIEIPHYIEPGAYVIEAELRWQENPIRQGLQRLPPWRITVMP